MTADQMRDLYIVQGRSQKDIAESHGVSQALVYLRLLEFGIKARPDGGRAYPKLDREELKGLFVDQHWTIKQLCEKYSCSKNTVVSNLRRYGILLGKQEVSRRTIERNKGRTTGKTTHKGTLLVRVDGHPYASKQGSYVIEHRLIVEKVIGRYLHSDEHVHHINIRHRDNWLGNLAVLNREQHKTVHWYMERVAAFLLGLADIRPEPLVFGAPVFWGGEWVESIDLIERSAARAVDPVRTLAKSIRENGLKYEFEDAA